VNGKVDEAKLLSQLASLSFGDVEKLMDMYSTFNFCSNLTSEIFKITEIQFTKLCLYSGGMDACDKASKLLQCGKENSPEAVAGLMKNLEIEMNVKIYIVN
jgi:hypothetical protein